MKKSVALDFFLLAAIIAVYTEASHFFVLCGGIRLDIMYFELPVTLLISGIFYFPMLKNRIARLTLALVPVFILYATFDITYHFWDRSVRVSDLSELPLLFDFYPMGSWCISIFIFGFMAGGIYLVYKTHKNVPPHQLLKILMARITVLGLTLIILFSPINTYYFNNVFDHVGWSQEKTIKKNGRIATIIFYNRREAANKRILSHYQKKKSEVNQLLFPGSIIHPKNIYFIVLESFFDPRRLKGVTFDPIPIHPDFSELLELEKQFSTVISPVYGGGTAQAEFELLTGVPALRGVESSEFNTLTEKKTSGFLSKLVASGYAASAFIASSSNYYNSRAAYTSLGFDKIIFLADEVDMPPEDKWVFDQDLLEYAYKNQDPNPPRFTYVLGMYGHFPYERNKIKRPDVIKTNSSDQRVFDIANQFFYRTKALANFIKKIHAHDPHSIIYITSDHLPPIMENQDDQESSKFNTISVMFVDGKQVDVTGKHFFMIPWRIYDELAGKSVKRDYDLEDLYLQVLAESLL